MGFCPQQRKISIQVYHNHCIVILNQNQASTNNIVQRNQLMYALNFPTLHTDNVHCPR